MKAKLKQKVGRAGLLFAALVMAMSLFISPVAAAQDPTNDFIFSQDATTVTTAGGTVDLTVSLPAGTQFSNLGLGLNLNEARDTYGCTVTYTSMLTGWDVQTGDFKNDTDRPSIVFSKAAAQTFTQETPILKYTVEVPAGLPEGTEINFVMNANACTGLDSTPYFNAGNSSYKNDNQVVFKITVVNAPAPPALEYSIVYDGDGNDGGTVPVDNNKYKLGDAVTVPTDVPTKTGYTFKCWKVNPEYQPGETFTFSDVHVANASAGNVLTLTAQWEANGNGSGAPKTGDESMIPLYAGLMIAALVGACIVMFCKRKKKIR